MTATLAPISLGLPTYRKLFLLWLAVVMGMVASIMVVGAITRLSDSGLSMVEWRLVFGALPPASQAEWERIFALYKTTSQFALQNYNMDLAGFKSIFWWEFLHRLLGRLIGLVYFVPMVLFFIKARPSKRLRLHMVLLLLLGGLQGVIGWWMVKSGFVDRTSVSHFRLSVHLGLAMLILLYLLHLWLSLRFDHANTHHSMPWAVNYLPAYIFFVVISGALVAGTKAGVGYNTWPLMDGGLWPDLYGTTSPWWNDALNNVASIQFHHRILAYVAVLWVLLAVWQSRNVCVPIIHHTRVAMMFLVFSQAVLGILTILHMVPIALAAMHQFGAILLIMAAFMLRFLWSRSVR